MNVFIIEDELHAVNYLTYLFAQCETDIYVLGHVGSVKAALEYLSEPGQIDVIFMDIHLEDGLSFEIFSHIDLKIPIIFTTAYDAYAIKAFDYLSIAYLLKPITKVELESALDKMSRMHDILISETRNSDLLKWPRQQRKSRFLIKLGNKYKYLNREEIVFIQSEGSITFLYTEKGRRFPYHLTMDRTLAELGEDKYFKIIRSQIIHIDDLKSTNRISGHRLICLLYSDRELTVSRNRVENFLQWMNS